MIDKQFELSMEAITVNKQLDFTISPTNTPIVVLIKLPNGKIHQVSLTQEMREQLYADLSLYFKGGEIQVNFTPVEGIDFDYPKSETPITGIDLLNPETHD